MTYGIQHWTKRFVQCSHFSLAYVLWSLCRLACFCYFIYCIICFMTLTSAFVYTKRWARCYSYNGSKNTYLNKRFYNETVATLVHSFIFSLFIQQLTKIHKDTLHRSFRCCKLFLFIEWGGKKNLFQTDSSHYYESTNNCKLWALSDNK